MGLVSSRTRFAEAMQREIERSKSIREAEKEYNIRKNKENLHSIRTLEEVEIEKERGKEIQDLKSRNDANFTKCTDPRFSKYIKVATGPIYQIEIEDYGDEYDNEQENLKTNQVFQLWAFLETDAEFIIISRARVDRDINISMLVINFAITGACKYPNSFSEPIEVLFIFVIPSLFLSHNNLYFFISLEK